MEKFEKLVDQEENRCREIVGKIKSTLAAEDALRREKSLEIKELEQQKLAAEGWREKREIGELIGTAREQNARRLYQDDGVIKQPYFAVLEIDDDKLGARSYCLGRQSFFDSKHQVLIVDWREAPISRLFYEYEAGEIYEELIRGQERTGTVATKRQVDTTWGRAAEDCRAGNSPHPAERRDLAASRSRNGRQPERRGPGSPPPRDHVPHQP